MCLSRFSPVSHELTRSLEGYDVQGFTAPSAFIHTLVSNGTLCSDASEQILAVIASPTALGVVLFPTRFATGFASSW